MRMHGVPLTLGFVLAVLLGPVDVLAQKTPRQPNPVGVGTDEPGVAIPKVNAPTPAVSRADRPGGEGAQPRMPPAQGGKPTVEWFGLSVGFVFPGVAHNSGNDDTSIGAFGAALILRSLTFGSTFRWTVLEAGGGFVLVGWYYSIGARVGYRFSLDTSARHQLEAGFGLGGGQGFFRISERGEDRGFRFGDEKGSTCLTPSVIFQYRYHRGGSLSFGASLRANLLIALDSDVAVWFAPTLMFDCGWST